MACSLLMTGFAKCVQTSTGPREESASSALILAKAKSSVAKGKLHHHFHHLHHPHTSYVLCSCPISSAGGGFKENDNIEYVKREDNEMYDEFGRKKKQFRQRGPAMSIATVS